MSGKVKTEEFLELINKRWKIFNIRTAHLHIDNHDLDSKPFTDLENEIDEKRLRFLREFVEYINVWESPNSKPESFDKKIRKKLQFWEIDC